MPFPRASVQSLWALLLGWGTLGCDAAGEARPRDTAVSGASGANAGGFAGSLGGPAPPADGAARFLPSAASPATSWRRLTQSEYRNVVRDVLGVEPPDAQLLPLDTRVAGFTSTAGQPLTVAAARRYFDAARHVGRRIEAAVEPHAPCGVANDGDGAAERICVESFLEDRGARLFRRPLLPEELQRYAGAFTRSRAQRSYQESLALVVEGLLVAPEFLFVQEPSGGAPGAAHALDGWQLASRLSLLLWDSAPDEPLLRDAQAGRLAEPDVLRGHVERLLGDARARGAVRSFFDDWLQLSRVEHLVRDPVAFPEVTPALLSELAEESRRYAEDVFWQSSDFRELFVSRARYRSAALSAFYRDALGATSDVERYEAEPSEQSFGLLSQAGILMTLAQSDKTAAIHRGAFVWRNLLCSGLPPPPAGLATPLPALTPGMTSRQRITQHTADPSCAGCHQRINPLGFALDQFDIGGRFREAERGRPIDATVELDAAELTATLDGARELSEVLADSERVRACLLQQLFAFALGRAPAAADSALFEALDRRLATTGSLRAVLAELALSEPFRTRVEPAQGALP